MSEQQAIVQEVEGEVSVTRNGEVVNIKSGDALLPGDQIVTGSTGRLSLEFPGLPGQDPATGVMTSNGKITLGEQEGPNGPQMVVMEDEECFDFTSEITELSAVTEDVGAAGLFGGVAAFGAGGGLAAAGLGAVAAGMFLGGGGGGGEDPATAQANAGGNASGGLLTGDNGGPIGSVLDTLGLGGAVGGSAGGAGGSGGGAAGGAGGTSGSPLQPVVNAVNQTPLAEPAKPLTDALIDATGGKGNTGGTGGSGGSGSGGTPGGGTAAAADPGPDNLIKAVQDTVGQVQNDPSKVNPVTAVQNIVNAGQTDLKEAASSNVGPDHLVNAVQSTASGLQSNPTGLDPVGTVQDLVSAGQKDLTELVAANPVNPADLVGKVVEAVNQTPLGEPLSPVTSALTDAVGQIPTDPLSALNGDSGIVSPIVEQLTNALSPVTEAAPQLTAVTDGLNTVANQVDNVLNTLLDAGSGLNAGGLSGGASALPLDSLLSAAPMGGENALTGALSQLTSGLESAAGSANPLTGALTQLSGAMDGATSGASPLDGLVSTLQGGAGQLTSALGGADLPTGDLGLPTGDLGGAGGLLGTVESLVSQLPTGSLSGGNPTDLLTTASNGISSAAADPSAPDLSTITNVLGKLL